MTAISSLLGVTGTGRASPASAAIANILVLVFLKSSASTSDIAVTGELLKAFSENKDLRDAFVLNFHAAMKKDRDSGGGMSEENGLHIALADTIMNNRSLFPPRAFSIRTEVAGGSIETEIPSLYEMTAGKVRSGSSAAVDRLATLLSAAQVGAAPFATGGAASGADVARAYASGAA